MKDLLDDPFGDDEPRRDFAGWQLLAAGIVIGALVTGLGWLAVASLSRGESPAGARAAVASRADDAPSTIAPSPSPRVDCGEVYADQQPVLDAAARSMSQWEVHVGAMNKLVNGTISLDQATAFWNRTRVGARHLLSGFDTSLAQYRSRTARCPAAGVAAGTPAAGTCPAAVAGRARVIRSADRALHTWAAHVRDMEMLRMGHMTPADATAMWLASWHEGVREIDAYRARIASVTSSCS